MIGRGVAKELRLAMRAYKVVQAHLRNARCGLVGSDDVEARAQIIDAMEKHVVLAKIAGAPMRKGKKP